MEIKNQTTWVKKDIDRKTRSNEWRINDARKFVEDYDNDPKKEQRLKNQTCKVCTYKGGEMAFQAFTDTNCSKCNEKMTFSSSSIDKLCDRCARMLDCCKHCGGNMD